VIEDSLVGEGNGASKGAEEANEGQQDGRSWHEQSKREHLPKSSRASESADQPSHREVGGESGRATGAEGKIKVQLRVDQSPQKESAKQRRESFPAVSEDRRSAMPMENEARLLPESDEPAKKHKSAASPSHRSESEKAAKASGHARSGQLLQSIKS
jgi:hypothetical protein